MSAEKSRPDHLHWARKLHEAAIDLRLNSRTPAALKLARRLERQAQAILFPQLPRWWPDGYELGAPAAPGGDD